MQFILLQQGPSHLCIEYIFVCKVKLSERFVILDEGVWSSCDSKVKL